MRCASDEVLEPADADLLRLASADFSGWAVVDWLRNLVGGCRRFGCAGVRVATGKLRLQRRRRFSFFFLHGFMRGWQGPPLSKVGPKRRCFSFEAAARGWFSGSRRWKTPAAAGGPDQPESRLSRRASVARGISSATPTFAQRRLQLGIDSPSPAVSGIGIVYRFTSIVVWDRLPGVDR